MAWGLIREDRLGGERFSPLGSEYFALTARDWGRPAHPNALIQIALDGDGQLPDVDWDF